ncbi:helix-turn-helix domain-containing protein [Guptibacillus algicola]|uniref:helix-turn-helix domain-containing protein n=1 Tax=Guptibacillus algicola TaxID=225844 RepID=UPI001CD312CD|nr:helix-turn-helix transcriptional regulator [Alkalihalobacillus algicola]MCA0987263.1 helix-turn-helix domain-containing protein [Alkalihalobacillus algicola]
MEVGQKKNTMSMDERSQQSKYNIKAGRLIREAREKKNLSVRGLGEKINISGNYVSEIERGIKPATNIVIRELSKELKIDEIEIFEAYNKVPQICIDELEESEEARNLIITLRESNLNQQLKKELYKKFIELHDLFEKY